MRAKQHDPEKWIPVFGETMRAKQHDPEKWIPDFGKDHFHAPAFGKDRARSDSAVARPESGRMRR